MVILEVTSTSKTKRRLTALSLSMLGGLILGVWTMSLCGTDAPETAATAMQDAGEWTFKRHDGGGLVGPFPKQPGLAGGPSSEPDGDREVVHVTTLGRLPMDEQERAAMSWDRTATSYAQEAEKLAAASAGNDQAGTLEQLRQEAHWRVLEQMAVAAARLVRAGSYLTVASGGHPPPVHRGIQHLTTGPY